ncbi:MAG: hypothetical protein LAN62_17910 [Acidobacteriia bacterium]|nr:hypothetical protein [Terriglobia bacterium]
MLKRSTLRKAALLAGLVLGISAGLAARNEVLGEVKFEGQGKGAKTSGVWIDGQYVGYLHELKGSKKVLLLPGEHEVVAQQAGYKEFRYKFVLDPGVKYNVVVAMEPNPQITYPRETASIKLKVKPNRAAVFVDGMYLGHVDEFNGLGQALLVGPGKHLVEIALPGYQMFRTEVDLLAHQKFLLKTELFPGSITQADERLVEKARAAGH